MLKCASRTQPDQRPALALFSDPLCARRRIRFPCCLANAISAQSKTTCWSSISLTPRGASCGRGCPPTTRPLVSSAIPTTVGSRIHRSSRRQNGNYSSSTDGSTLPVSPHSTNTEYHGALHLLVLDGPGP